MSRKQNRKNKKSLLSIVSAANEFLWALVGLLLTICGTFVEAFTTTPPWAWAEQGINVLSLGVTYQIGAVLLTGCLGGKNAGALSQIAYIVLGLTWLPVFSQGGGLSYLKEPSFGYVLGFVTGAWICGFFAFKTRLRLESLALSCICGLLTIHLSGLTYLLSLHFLTTAKITSASLLKEVLQYSVYPLPGQLVIVCATCVIAYFLRKFLLFY